MKKMIAINGSPRAMWNTGTLVREAAKGAESEGAEVKVIDLYQLEKFTGCISCFGCKLPEHKGVCVCQDGLSPVLEEIRQADGLIIGDTLQVDNYDKYNWTYFDPEAKKKRHETVFLEEKKKAFALGAEMVKGKV